MDDSAAKPKAVESQPTSTTWARDGFYLRLTPGRRELLKSMASGLGASASPVDAVDRALQLASIQLEGARADDGLDNDRLDDGGPTSRLAEAIEAISSEWRTQRQALSAEMRSMADSVDTIRRLISEAVDDGPDGSATPQKITVEIPSVEHWFADEFTRLGLRVEKAAIARARWIASRRAGDSSIGADFDLELAGADGKPLPKGTAGGSTARVAGLAPGGPLGIAGMEPFFFVAQPLPHGRWAVSAYRQEADGSIGEKLCWPPARA